MIILCSYHFLGYTGHQRDLMPIHITLKASVCNFYQNFNIHTLRCDFLYINDPWSFISYTQIAYTHENISKGEKIILSRWIFHLCRFSCTLSLKEFKPQTLVAKTTIIEAPIYYLNIFILGSLVLATSQKKIDL